MITQLKILCSTILFIASCSIASSQWIVMKSDGDSVLTKGIDAIYNVQFDSASTNFQEVIRLYPNHPAGYFLDAMVLWWRINLDRLNKKYDEPFLAKIDKVIEVCDKLEGEDKNNITSLFFRGGALGFRGRYHSIRENYFSAVTDGKDALEIMNNCHKLAPGNHDIMLGSGIYNYYAAVLPERTPVIKPFMAMFPSGDKELGIYQLKAAAEKAKYARYEAKDLLRSIYMDYEKNGRESIIYARELNKRYPLNPYFHHAFAKALVMVGPSDTAEIVWRDILTKCLDKQPFYNRNFARDALYYIGMYRMNSNDFDNALRYFYKSDEACRVMDQDPGGIMVRTNLKIGQIYDMQNKRDLAIKQYNKVLSWKDLGNSHEEAKRYLAKPFSR